MIRVFIADDHKIFRKGLKQTIDDNAGMSVTGEAANAQEALQCMAKSHFDVAVLDISMPGVNGLELLKLIKEEAPQLPVIFLSMHPEEQYALRAMKAGAAGYLTKDADEEHIVEAIRKASGGGKYITPSLAEKLAFAVEIDHDKPVHEKLSDREFQVMRLIGQGASVGDIAAKLNLSISTVSTYRARIIEKTGLKSNSEIIIYVMENKILD